MQLGIVGLGKMGGNMRDRLRAGGHTVVGYDQNQEISDSTSLADMVDQLGGEQRIVWLMVPVQAIDAVLKDLTPLLKAGDIVIDGGNTRWSEDGPRAAALAESGIHFLDCGVSGGVWGKDLGYALMVGGPAEIVETCLPIFQTLKPDGEHGYVHAGDHGAGHFAKMVHNGIEYAVMQAYAEGWELLEAADTVTDHVPAIFESWQDGTVIRSWLLELLVRALKADDDLSEIRGYAEDSGEGRWTVEAAIDMAVPVPAISSALFARFTSRQEDSPAMKMIAAMRNQFGGHAVMPETED